MKQGNRKVKTRQARGAVQSEAKKKFLQYTIFVAAAVLFVLVGILVKNTVSATIPKTQSELMTGFLEKKMRGRLPKSFPENYRKEFSDLYRVNKEIQGVVYIPNTDLIAPVVKTTENHSYTKRDFFGVSSDEGVPFMDYRSAIDPTEGNLLIYGTGQAESGFQILEEYRAPAFATKNNLIHFDSVLHSGEYQVFSAFLTKTVPDGDAGYFDYSVYVKSVDSGSFREVVKECERRSILNFDVDVDYGDELLMLATSTDDFEDAQLVVVARKLRETEHAQEMNISAKENKDVVYPDAWYTAKGIKKPEPVEISEVNILPEQPIETAPLSTAPEKPKEEAPKEEVSKVVEESKAPEAPSKPESSVAPPPPEPSLPESSTPPPEVSNEPSLPESSVVSPPAESETLPSGGSSGTSGISLTINDGSGVFTGDATEIVSQIVAAELSPNYPEEALKAQAVATYTYIVYHNNQGKSPYMPLRSASQKIVNAVASVIGQTVQYGGRPIFAAYHAMSAGRTNSAAEVWGDHIPYLVSVESRWDESVSSFNTTRTFSEEEVRQICEREMAITMEGDPSTWFEVLSYSSGGYNELMRVGGHTKNGRGRTITGRMIREAVLTNLRSAAFTVSYSNGTFTFHVKGYGHGVGLSQWGAFHMARNGSSYQEILAYYYPGTSVS